MRDSSCCCHSNQPLYLLSASCALLAAQTKPFDSFVDLSLSLSLSLSFSPLPPPLSLSLSFSHQVSLRGTSSGTIREIANEIQIMEGLKHPHLVQYYGVEVHKVSRFSLLANSPEKCCKWETQSCEEQNNFRSVVF